jgi:hypothetical protein
MTKPVNGESAPILLDQIYAQQMRIHAIMLVWLGYRRLDSASLTTAEEDDITGELVREVRLMMQESTIEWFVWYEVSEQVRQNVAGKKGKRRPIMDIEFERHGHGLRPCLGFEAKTLGRGNTIGNYLGDEGLAAFLNGYYPTTNRDAGMLAYIQRKPIDEWSEKLAQELTANCTKHSIAEGGQLQTFDAEPTMPAFRSCHTDISGKPLFVIHILLSFVQEE